MLDIQIEQESGLEARLELLARAASVAEGPLNDPVKALAYTSRGLKKAAAEPVIDEWIARAERLSERTSGWADLAQLYRISGTDWLGWLSAGSAVAAAAILVMHLVRRPPVGRSTKLWLLLGLGVFPISSATTANIAGFHATQSRNFCGSCHVMEPHARDSDDPRSTSLAAIHARNETFGHDNCYACHKDYGMYGYVLTKAGEMRHVYYYLTQYRKMPLAEAQREIRIRKPLPNENCMSCHTTNASRWQSIGDHASSLQAVRSGRVGCASPGCHGYAHPMTKANKELSAFGDTSSEEQARRFLGGETRP